jgi:very-short-patch-repair endonuclease
MLQGDVAQARRLRRSMSLPEVLLWRELQQRPGGYKFRRQQPAGRLTPDFYCHQSRLIVEVDGEAHGRGDRPARDAEREVMRVTARDVLNNREGTVRGIVYQAARRGPPLPDRAPEFGEDQE